MMTALFHLLCPVSAFELAPGLGHSTLMQRQQRQVHFNRNTCSVCSCPEQPPPLPPQEFHALPTPWDGVEAVPAEHATVTGL